MSDSAKLMYGLLALFASGASLPAIAQVQQKSDDKGNFSLVVENDSIGALGTDKGYTSGVRASWVTSPQNTPDGRLMSPSNFPSLPTGARFAPNMRFSR